MQCMRRIMFSIGAVFFLGSFYYLITWFTNYLLSDPKTVSWGQKLTNKILSKEVYMYTLPSLPYAYDALEPYIDARTMEIHHNKHHQAYVDNLNKALEGYPELQQKPLEQLLKNLASIPEKVRNAIGNNGGGHYNHSFFWGMMKKNGGGQPHGQLAQEIIKIFGSFEKFQEQFNAAAKAQFGSGWAWLVLDKNGRLLIKELSNQDTPLAYEFKPIMCLDVWEHAYYLKYQNRRPDYISAWWNVVNWDGIEQIYQALR